MNDDIYSAGVTPLIDCNTYTAVRENGFHVGFLRFSFDGGCETVGLLTDTWYDYEHRTQNVKRKLLIFYFLAPIIPKICDKIVERVLVLAELFSVRVLHVSACTQGFATAA